MEYFIRPDALNEEVIEQNNKKKEVVENSDALKLYEGGQIPFYL